MPGTPRPARRLSRLAHAVLVASLAAVAAVAATPAVAAPASTGAWTATSARPSADRPRTVTPTASRSFQLRRGALDAELATGVVSLPDPRGRLESFAVTADPVMTPGLAARHPEIRTWSGRSLAGTATLSLDVALDGVHAAVLGDGDAWYVDPAYRGATASTLHLSYDLADLPAPQRPSAEPPLDPRIERAARDAGDSRTAASGLEEGAGQLVQLHTYRLALLSDPTFAAYVAPGAVTHAASDPLVLAAKTVLVSRLNQLYGADLSVKFLLADHTDDRLNLMSDAEATGPHGPCGAQACFPAALLGPASGCSLDLLARQRWVLGQLVGAHDYDVGHFSLGINSGGVAYPSVVGLEMKGEGCTGLDPPASDAYTVDYLAHELGHQFGASHTFDGNLGGCSGNRDQTSAVEPGSGSSIMAYAGICGADDLQGHSDPYFASVTRDQVAGFLGHPPYVVREVQSVALDHFDGTDGFTFTYAGTPSPAVVRGSSYTATGIANAASAACGCAVTVKSFFNDLTGDPVDDRGFTLVYSYGSGNVATPTVTPTVGSSFTVSVNDVDQGGFNVDSLGAVTTTANHNPTVGVPAARTIPRQTPFALTGSGSDADGDPLVYTWEQVDAGDDDGQELTDVPKTAGPLFRDFGTASSTFANVATSSPTRVFPDLAQVLADNTDAATGACPAGGGLVDCLSEWLPTAAYTPSALHFRLTAQDLAGAGGVDSRDVALTVDKTAGPFRVTSQSSGATLTGGTTVPVTWSVNNTAPLASTVRIMLSTDGGSSWGTLLKDNTPNDGAENVTLPDLTIADARIRVAAIGNYFFDVNHAPFAIQSSGGGGGPTLAVSWTVPNPVAAQYSDPPSTPLSFTGTSTVATGSALTLTAALPAGLTLAKQASGSSATWTLGGTAQAAPGSHTFHVTVSDGHDSLGHDVTVLVSPEDASVTYTSPASVVGADPGAHTVPVTATASVVQAADGHAGSLDAATVTFTDSLSGARLCTAAAVTVAGVATCHFDADLSGGSPVTYHVALAVGGSFTGHSAGDATLTVSLPAPTGGGGGGGGGGAAPETTITAGPTGWLLGSTTTIGFASSVAGSTFLCRLDGAPLACGGGSVTLTGLGAGTHHVTVAAQDSAGGHDDTPAVRDFAVPVDDRALAAAAGRWQRKHAGAAYDGSYSAARRKGATLTYQVTGVRELAIVVGTGKRYGKVRVYLDKTLLGTVSLKGSPRFERVVGLAAFASPRSGTVRVVAANARQVRVDGLGVSTLAF